MGSTRESRGVQGSGNLRLRIWWARKSGMQGIRGLWRLRGGKRAIRSKGIKGLTRFLCIKVGIRMKKLGKLKLRIKKQRALRKFSEFVF